MDLHRKVRIIDKLSALPKVGATISNPKGIASLINDHE
jgi:hypothetical protein